MFKFFRIMLAIMAAVLFVAPAFAQEATTPPAVAKLTLGENQFIELHYFLQVQGNMADVWTGSADNKTFEHWNKDVMIKRSRIVLKGQVAENLTFFMETDDIKLGSQGKGSSVATTGDTGKTDDDGTGADESHNHTYTDKQGVFTQDAFINYKVADALEIAVGQILLPFMHHDRVSSVKILGINYNDVIPLATTTNNWRDTGIEFRGLLMNGLIDYRVGAFQGVQAPAKVTAGYTNPYDEPRLCGRVQINFMDAENEFFYSDNYLGKKNIISVGGGIDYQNNAARNIDKELSDYMAWTADVTVDTKISDMVCTVHGAYVSVKNQPNQALVASEIGQADKQNGYFVEAGLLIGKIQPVIKYASMKKVDADLINNDDLVITTGTIGINYFISGHNANIKAEYVQPLSSDAKDTKGSKQVNFQAQIFI